MSVQDLPPELDETATEPEDLTVRRLVRAIDYAEGFWLGFAKSNTPAQRRRLAALCRDLLEPLKIRVLEIELNEPITDLLPILRERLAQEHAASDGKTTTDEAHEATRPKLAIFVHGLERSIPSREAYPPLLSALNLKRELFRQEVPHPLLLWLPDYALTALARKAPDFWAWRSGLYEFAPDRDAAEQSLQAISDEAMHVTDSLPEQAKHERLIMLKGLLDDYRELGDGTREQEARGSILNTIGLLHQTLDEWTEARQAFEQALTIARELKNNVGEAAALHNLGQIVQGWGEAEEAHRLHRAALEIERKLGNQLGIALNVWGLANISFRQGDLAESKQLSQEVLKIFRTLGDQANISGILHQLGIIAQTQGELKEARRLYDEALEIERGLGDQSGVAYTVGQLGNLAAAQGDFAEARRFYNDCLEISKALGQQSSVANSLNNLGMLAVNEGNTVEAARLLREALNIFERLRSPNVEITRRNLAAVEGREDISN